MRIALTIWEGRISPVFDVSRTALIVELENGQVQSTWRTHLNTSVPHQKLSQLVDLGVQTLICGAISRSLQRLAPTNGLELIGFVAGEVEEVLEAYISGQLIQAGLSMPGCSAQRQGPRPSPQRRGSPQHRGRARRKRGQR